MCSSADKEDGDRHVMWSNDQAEAGAKISKSWLPVRHGTCVAVQTKRMETGMLCGVMTKLKQVQKSANDLAIPTQ